MTVGKEIKCVVWDLDETLWSGTLLESEAVTLKSGVRDVIETLDQRGVLHSIASRNNFDDAMRKLQEFGLAEYFLFPQIGWGEKSASIDRIRTALNIGFESLLFIDDQPYERDEVRHRHPAVVCIPAEQYAALPECDGLKPRFITPETGHRRRMYLEDIRRTQEEAAHEGPAAEFLRSLKMKFVISEASSDDLQRAAELTVRTHQLNSTGRTYDFAELDAFRTSSHHRLLICELEDRYGSYGKIGLALLEKHERCDHIRLLIVSCRVMSRGVGTILLGQIMRLTKQANKALRADFRPTPSNRQMYIAYKFANFREMGSGPDGNLLLENDLSVIQEQPPHVEVIVRSHSQPAMDIRSTIREFIRKNINTFDDNLELRDGDNIFKLGFVDSLFAMKLVGFIEKEFGVEMHNDDLKLANFSSVDAIAALLDRKGR